MKIEQIKRWSNWSGSVNCSPTQFVKPGSIEELANFMRQYGSSGRHVRVVGAGHSFTPLVQSDDVLMSLEHMQGITSVDSSGSTVTVLAGTTLKNLGQALHAHGLAQENLGDIDVQSIAGAISTGTHGTGVNFGTLATQVVGLTLVTASGEILECSLERNQDLFRAAQVSLGMLGVIAAVTLRVVPAKRLQYHTYRERLSVCLANVERYKQENAHFEFFWFPYTDWVQIKFANETEAQPDAGSLWGNFNKVVLENGVYWLLSECNRLVPRLSRAVCNISAQGIASVKEVDYSHRIYATPRVVRFQEMEYNIPAEYFGEVLPKIKACIDRYGFEVHFPVECRFVQADDIWLSPAYQRASAYIAVHMYRGMPYKAYFEHIEEIYQDYQGRPHWGKLHTLTAERLAALYPRWHDFRRMRAQLDPEGIFLNAYLRELFAADLPIPSDDTSSSAVSS
ncbi:FAD-binding protein [Ktedonosporobacter rubrisoli]|uniref:FAD-binding protein n=1 Tax=Ktedonosporobacter rubrisoli TaxID=2509675 RepID=A0A4P6JYP3_KTERU|nr:D-arabinono-1,4-lactone oxidase [Ktedonosporobacter rubrisoli]QBD80166.1 FAD-binding protein [Ktedonosporobacter rubrisoli]